MEWLNQFNTKTFMEEVDFEHFIDLIGGDQFIDPIANFGLDYDYANIGGCLDDTQLGPDQGTYILGSNCNFSSSFSGLPHVNRDRMEGEEENDFDEESSATTSGTTMKPTKRKGDRTRTLITERQRRGRMKDKLYALRALVPNITKMDKASIVGDAVLYVQDLQLQAKKLRDEIAGLQLLMTGADTCQNDNTVNQKNLQFSNQNSLISKKVLQISMFQVEERGLYVRIESKRGQGVAASLYKALESLTTFKVQSSNLATLEAKFILTFTLKALGSESNINLQDLKVWLTKAFMKQGFEFQEQQSGCNPQSIIQ